jgi:hypothetical protein
MDMKEGGRERKLTALRISHLTLFSFINESKKNIKSKVTRRGGVFISIPYFGNSRF